MTDTDRKRERYQTDPAARERMLEYNREWRRQNTEKLQAQRARYRARHREALRAKQRSPEVREYKREYNRRYGSENAEQIRAQQRTRYQEDPSRREYQRQHGLAWREANADYVRELQRTYRDRNEQVITSRATNGRTPWTDAELRIALDPSLSLTEAALMLGRTVTAVGQKRYKARRAAS